MNDGLFKIYGELHNLNKLKRSGWVYYGIKEPETVMEHMYDASLMAMILLPDDCDVPGYDKNRIAKMLMIHDFAEIRTGDIIAPLKNIDPSYEYEENLAMESILNEIGSDELIEIWNEWCDLETYNSKVAKDLDVLQSVAAFCHYRKTEGKLREEFVTSNWIGKHKLLTTDLGMELYKTIMRANSEDLEDSEYFKGVVKGIIGQKSLVL